jgi:hypothetical protein
MSKSGRRINWTQIHLTTRKQKRKLTDSSVEIRIQLRLCSITAKATYSDVWVMNHADRQANKTEALVLGQTDVLPH